jgi:hypothetical protein
MEALGGTLDIQSEENKGTKVILNFSKKYNTHIESGKRFK